MSTVDIIDGDILLYRICYTVSPDASLNEILFRVDEYMENLFKRLGSSKYIGILQTNGKDNKKYLIFPEYKKGRPVDKPPHWNIVMNYLFSEWRFVAISACETDDCIAACVVLLTERNIPCRVVSADKDLLQIPGHHFVLGVMRKGNIVRNDQKIYVTEDDSLKQLAFQMLAGDLVDNVSGIKGIGKVKANNLLANKTPQEMTEIVKEAYRQQYPDNWQDVYTVNLALLKIDPYNAFNMGFNYPGINEL